MLNQGSNNEMNSKISESKKPKIQMDMKEVNVPLADRLQQEDKIVLINSKKLNNQRRTSKINHSLSLEPSGLQKSESADQTNFHLRKKKKINEENYYFSNKICEICKFGNNENSLLLCDLCDDGYHISCMEEMFKMTYDSNKEEWICFRCDEVLNGNNLSRCQKKKSMKDLDSTDSVSSINSSRDTLIEKSNITFKIPRYSAKIHEQTKNLFNSLKKKGLIFDDDLRYTESCPSYKNNCKYERYIQVIYCYNQKINNSFIFISTIIFFYWVSKLNNNFNTLENEFREHKYFSGF